MRREVAGPMPPTGWPAVYRDCCAQCRAWWEVERELRAYYGPLFACEDMGG